MFSPNRSAGSVSSLLLSAAQSCRKIVLFSTLAEVFSLACAHTHTHTHTHLPVDSGDSQDLFPPEAAPRSSDSLTYHFSAEATSEQPAPASASLAARSRWDWQEPPWVMTLINFH